MIHACFHSVLMRNITNGYNYSLGNNQIPKKYYFCAGKKKMAMKLTDATVEEYVFQSIMRLFSEK